MKVNTAVLQTNKQNKNRGGIWTISDKNNEIIMKNTNKTSIFQQTMHLSRATEKAKPKQINTCKEAYPMSAVSKLDVAIAEPQIHGIWYGEDLAEQISYRGGCVCVVAWGLLWVSLNSQSQKKTEEADF